MNILFIHQNLTGTTGEAVESKEFIKALLRGGHRVGILYKRYQAAALEVSEAGEHLIDLGCLDISMRTIQRRITEFKPDIGHIKSCWTPFHAKAAWFMRKKSIPYVVEPGGHFLPVHFTTRFAERPFTLRQKILKHAYRRLVDTPMLKGASAVRALSPFEAEMITRDHDLECYTLPQGINAEYYIENPRQRSLAPGEMIRFLFVGRLDIFQKGLDLILSASKTLNSEGFATNFEVILAGPPLNGSDTRLDQEIADLNLPNVRTHPPVRGQDKIDLFNSCHVFLHPSRFEEMAKLPREAIATGLAVIASPESNFGDWAASKNFGFAPGLNAESLALAMRHFILDHSLVKKCSAAAIDFAFQCTWDDIASGLHPMYESCLH